MSVATANPPGATAVRRFEVRIPRADLDDLRRRIAATRRPDEGTVPDRCQGVQLAKLRPLVGHRGSAHERRAVEATLNALPRFITEIDALQAREGGWP